jgi:hypothetical protein
MILYMKVFDFVAYKPDTVYVEITIPVTSEP